VLSRGSSVDSFQYLLPVFDSYLKIDKNSLCGYWTDRSRGDQYRVPVCMKSATTQKTDSLEGRWKLSFEDDYEGLLMLSTVAGKLQGTILTETGDYRYLHGTMSNNKLQLQCFDGSHLFLFEADQIGDSLINGVFYSGNHYRDQWIGVKTNSKVLRDPDKILTTNDSALSFTVYDSAMNAQQFDSSSFRSKLTIVQIMGSWCPNCMDESRLLKTLYDEFSDKGLEIMAVGFERHKDPKDAWKAIEKSKLDLELNYPIYYCGKADKSYAASVFPMLDALYSFPTTLFISKDGKLIDQHSGFNGPATGKAHEEQVKKIRSLIKKELELN